MRAAASDLHERPRMSWAIRKVVCSRNLKIIRLTVVDYPRLVEGGNRVGKHRDGVCEI